MIKSRRMKWMWHVACVKEMRNAWKNLGGKPEGKNCLEPLEIDGKVILKFF
jgi:hypothetical protein